jgi:hypothetical protein
MRNRSLLMAIVAVAGVVALIAVAVAVFRGDDSSSTADVDPALVIANTFPTPLGATPAFPDSAVGGVATKGWRAAGSPSLESACVAWREAYRGWVDQGQSGSITGSDEDGRRCTLSGPKSGYVADLSLTLYGDDPTPSAVLTVRLHP